MGKFAKFILISIIAVVIFYALAILAANLYLQSRDVQKRIRAATSQAAGTEVEIHNTYYTPWSGLVVSGVKAQYPADAGLPLMEVKSIHLRFALLSLLQGQLVISDVLLSHPSLTSLKQRPAADSSPSPESSPDSAEATPESSASVTPGPMVEMPPASATPPPLFTKQVSVKIERVRIRNGQAVFLDEKGAIIASLDGIRVDAEPLAHGNVSGEFQIRDINLLGIIRPRDTKGRFSWENGALSIPQLVADWAGGKLSGKFKMQSQPEERFAITISAESVSLKKLAIDAGLSGEGTKGRLHGKGEISGLTQDPESFEGNAQVSLRKARLQPLDVIRQLGELLRIEELQMLQFKTAEAFFTIHDEKVMADKILLESENLIMDATGPANFEGKLKLRARLHLNEKLSKNFRQVLGRNLEASEREGYCQMPFSVTGSITRPKTDLLDRLIGIKIGQDVGGLLRNLFRAPPAEEKSPEIENSAP